MEKTSAIPEGYMRIGEMAKKAGITVRTLSYYDKEGLLPPCATSDGGYRLYTDKDMVRLIQIIMLKELGFPLSEIKKRLTQLDTPEDVRAMLAEQSAHVRKKIELLTDSLDAMEALNAEIAQMETVNFKKYAAILMNLQIKNEGYRVIKHFDDEVLDMFRERIGREKAALMTATLHDLYEEAARLVAESVPHESEVGQIFAVKLWESLVELSGGDIDMMFKLDKHMDKASKLEGGSSEERSAVRAFMSQALKVYHTHTHIDTDINALMIKFGISSYEEAFKLHKDGITPESEKAQDFIMIFWRTMLELTDGNIDLLMQLSEQAEKAENQDEKSVISRRFIESALEVYLKNQSEGS